MIRLFSALGSRDNIPLLSAFAVILSILFAWQSPEEATLGQAIRLVFMHAALMWVAFGLLTIGGLTGAIYLIRRSHGFLAWSNGTIITAVTLLFATGVLGLVTAKITWGGIYWAEPRLLMLGQILVAGAATAGVRVFRAAPVWQASANLIYAGLAWALLLRTEKVIHPVSPIFTSESAAVKLFPLMITACVAFAALQVVRYLVKPPA